jgi:DNA ligase (NAD+)
LLRLQKIYGSTIRSDGAKYFCYNELCHDQVVARLQHALGKAALDFDGAGPAFVEALVSSLKVSRLSDILSLTSAQVAASVGRSAGSKFEAEVARVKTVPMWRKIYALGVELVGVSSSKDLCAQFSSILDIAGAGLPKLTEILGPVAASNLVKFLQNNAYEIDRLATLGYTFSEIKVPQASSGDKPLAGKCFVVTGTLESSKRPQMYARIEAAGGTTKGSVSKGVDYLVVGDGAGAGQSTAAAKLGTKCISELELYQMAGWKFEVQATPKIDQW